MKTLLKKISSMAAKASCGGERGVALIFTLGILGLLTVIALSFAASAINERKSANNNNNQTAARLLARSGLERVMGALSYYTTLTGGDVFDDFYTHDTSSSVSQNQKNYDWLWKLSTTTADGRTLYTLSNKYSPNVDTAVHWQYVTNGKSGDDAELIGRFAYVVIRGGGKLDPSACVDSSKTIMEGSETRPGRDVNEINAQNVDPSFSFLSAAMTEDLTTELPVSGKWTDFNQLFGALGISSFSIKNAFKEQFQVGADADPEAVWLDNDGDGKKKSTEYYHRFNLRRTDWDSITVANIYANPVLYAVGDSEATVNAGGIRWLNQWTDAGGMGSVATCKKQIAANIKDCCDTDEISTSDSSDWSTTAPTYTGLEKTPYINEIALKVESSVTITGPYDDLLDDPDAGSIFYDYAYKVKVFVGGEIIDIYGGLAYSMPMTVAGNVYYKYNTPSGMSAEVTLPFSGIVNFSGGDWNSGYNFLIETGACATSSSTATKFTDGNSAAIQDVKVQVTKVILNLTADCDYSAPDSSSYQSDALNFFSGASTGESKTGYYAYQVDDPRQNLRDSDWPAPKVQLNSYPGTNASSSPAYVNSALTINAAGNDIEAVTNPAYVDKEYNKHLSTAYIHNAPMLSPWELGCIHRGEKWKTLNLKLFRENYKGIPGTYAEGDANILDQIKMTSANSCYGKVNLNSDKPDVLRALFQGIYVRMNDPSSGNHIYEDPGAALGGTLINQTYAEVLASALKTANSSSSGSFKTRSQILRKVDGMRQQICGVDEDGNAVNAIDGSSTWAFRNDAEHEEIIGKFINLTKAEPGDQVTVIVLAQTIKDVGSLPSESGVTLYRDWDNDGDVTGSGLTDAASMFNAGYRTYSTTLTNAPSVDETITDCKKAQYDRGADLITSEQKIVAVLSYDTTTMKWSLLSFEYVDD